MKRRLFFWFEQLKISRNERRVVFTLLITLSGLVLINAIATSHSPFNKAYYASLDKRFKARTLQMRKQNRQRMERYHGIAYQSAQLDSLPKDSSKKKKDALNVESYAGKLINVNAANATTLQKLKGIGPAYAHRIVAYRQKNGPFKTKADLIKIKGIGKKRLANIKPFIKLTAQK